MNITELFTRENENDLDIRITCGNRWMVMDDTTHELIVYEKRYYQRNTYLICQTQDEDLAYKFLTTNLTNF